jgi:hypothetical protein
VAEQNRWRRERCGEKGSRGLLFVNERYAQSFTEWQGDLDGDPSGGNV